MLATFDRPGQGIRCAVDLRERLRHLGVEVRAGLHAGEVLVSRTVHDLVAGSDLVLEDRGAHTLKGMAGQWQLSAVRS